MLECVKSLLSASLDRPAEWTDLQKRRGKRGEISARFWIVLSEADANREKMGSLSLICTGTVMILARTHKHSLSQWELQHDVGDVDLALEQGIWRIAGITS